ncbi:MAG TPA: AIR synthase-related protein [Actinomycetota bacterium]|nr:AIR synthase-related protein [Actinomycetota bacterium]
MSDTYRAAGVNYEVLDQAKRVALEQAAATSSLLAKHGGRALDTSRGEPAFVFTLGDKTFAFVLECLGTKSVLARRYLETTGEDRFANVAYDTVAAIVNDLICPGALPLVVNAYFSTGSDRFFSVASRLESLVAGWRNACQDAGATWGGGESPTLTDLVAGDDVELAGSAVGIVPEGRRPLLGDELGPGDEIVLIASTGLHANGASLVRAVADRSSEGLERALPDGRTLGDAALVPARIYVPLVAALAESEVEVTYMTHITGHGLRKLMRPARPLTYRVSKLPEVPSVLSFLTRELSMEARDAYGTFNMGAGYAVYCATGTGERVVELAKDLGMDALAAGVVEAGPRRVILEPLDVTYEATDLQLR